MDRPQHSGRPSKNGRDAPTISQRQAAKEAGLSENQQVTAVRVNNVPRAQFEALVESDKPPSITTLAQTDFKKSTRAQLPAVYEKAKIALKECAQIDECQQWADRAKALASYAKDETGARPASAWA